MNDREFAPIRTALILLAVAGLVIDAVVHLHVASTYDANRTSALSQGDLFRAEAGLAILAALLLVLRPRRYTALFAFLVSAGGAALVAIYRYVNVGRIGIIPQMYENTWTPAYANPWKALSFWAEVLAALASLALLFLLHQRARRSRLAAPLRREGLPVR